MRILALDVGDSRIGVAVSDELQIIAQALGVIQRSGIASDIKRIEDLCKSYDVAKVVVGLPITLMGEIGIQGQKVLEFTKALQQALALPVIMRDERLTTVQANKILRESNVSEKRGKKSVDSIAAAIILESYLGSLTSDRSI
jgi:putative Holliday junction resolvase